MEYKTLEINVNSAKDLKDLNLFSKMGVYVVVSLSGDKQKAKTKVDRDGGTSPSWNFPMKFTIDESAARQNRQNLEFKLRCDRNLGGDKDIGEVHVPVAELLNSTGDGKSMQFVSYQVTKPSGKPQGILNFSYKFTDKVAAGREPPVPEAKKAYEPVTAYPAAAVVGTSAMPYDGFYPPATAPPPPPPPYGYGYPPPPPGYGYPPPPPGYGYPPPPPGYGYPPAVQQPQKKNKFGMGLGAGLLGGALGGLLIGDMVSDAGGCDAGFGDFGGF